MPSRLAFRGGARGDTPSVCDARCRLVDCVNCEHRVQDSRLPDPLAPFVDPYSGHLAAAPFSILANTNQPVWLDVAIPAQAAAGTYAGIVTVTYS